MRRFRRGLAASALFAATAAVALAGDVVVLKGGTVIELKQPWVRRGNTAYLTRSDGTLLSVPVSEIDRDATAAAERNARPARPAPSAPEPTTPAEAVRVSRDAPKARVRITDADVSHPMEIPSGEATEKKEESVTGARVEIADYTQEKAGNSLIVKGNLRNPTQTTAENVHLSVSAIDEKGQAIGGANAVLSKGAIESGQSVSFTASIALPPEKAVSTLRFAPQWTATPKASETAPRAGGAAPAGGAPAGGAAAANKPPAPAPTPYGRGTLYAPPVANAPSEPSPDGKTGYIPGAAHPDNQPKPPVP